ncbi:YkvI family membrane protein [Lutispora sp.]|nr:hypothetical protein [Lutispora sp.]MEA4961386.1 hypothetical protein [Lutispora sp.]
MSSTPVSVTQNERISWLTVIKIAGVFVSWAIGSGFVTGQETLQYFCGYGIYGYAGIAIAMLLHAYLIVSFFKLGYEKRFSRPLEIFTYYCGEKIGKVFQVLALGLMFSAPVVMISGFGAALNQHFGISSSLGSIILGVLCLITIILGLRKLVDIIGTMGPFIIVLALGTGMYYLFNNIDGLKHGIEIAPTLKMSRIAPTWWLAGLYYTTCTPMHSAPFFAATATTVKVKKEAVYGGILGVILYGLGGTTMFSATFTNIEVLSQQMIPNLYIANSISTILGYAFILVIFLGIYSSCVPSMFALCVSFRKEKTHDYNVFATVLVTVSVLCSLLLPFDKLLGLVYGAYGVIGGVFVLFIIAKQYQEKKAKYN